MWIQDAWDDHVVYAVETPGGTEPSPHFSVPYSIGDDMAVTLGVVTPVMRQVAYIQLPGKAQFSVSEAIYNADGTVTVPALLFECGHYPDKEFSLTPEEADAWVGAANFPILIDHKASVFTKGDPHALGTVTRTWRDGNTIFGDITFKAWAKDGLKEKAIPLSVGFDPVTKVPEEVSIVTSPRITTAKVLSMFGSARPDEPARKGSVMNIIETLKAFFGGLSAEEKAQFSQEVGMTQVAPVAPLATAPVVQAPAAAPVAFDADPRYQTMREDLITIKSGELAVKFASDISPDAVAKAKVSFAIALKADNPVTFSDDTALEAGVAVKAQIEMLSVVPKIAKSLKPGEQAQVHFGGASETVEIGDAPLSAANRQSLKQEVKA